MSTEKLFRNLTGIFFVVVVVVVAVVVAVAVVVVVVSKSKQKYIFAKIYSQDRK